MSADVICFLFLLSVISIWRCCLSVVRGTWNRPLPHFLGCFSSFACILHVVGAKSEVFAETGRGRSVPKYTSDKVNRDAQPRKTQRRKHIQAPCPSHVWTTEEARNKETLLLMKCSLLQIQHRHTDDSYQGNPLVTCQHNLMKAAYLCLGNGLDFEGSVFVRWKVLSSLKCRKKTFNCRRKQVGYAPVSFVCSD
jgi:hypothetical protein